MTLPIGPSPSPHGPSPLPVAQARASGASFRDHLAEAVRSIGANERSVDGALERVTRRGAMSTEELIAFQASIYRHSLSVDIASKVVEKATSAVRQILQSQPG
jgi:hypothetical protein